MKSLRNNESGFHVVEFILIAAVVVGLGFAGWRVYDANQAKDVPVSTEQQATDPQAKLDDITVVEINNSEDLDQAKSMLDELESNEILDESQFDEDVDELL